MKKHHEIGAARTVRDGELKVGKVDNGSIFFLFSVLIRVERAKQSGKRNTLLK
jgi:hypothetical protein